MCWERKDEESGQESGEEEEGLLVPGKGLVQKARAGVRPPVLPPPEMQSHLEAQHRLLMTVIDPRQQKEYPS